MVDQFGRVKLTNPDKVLYPATGTTKAEVFDYYVNIAEAMIPHIAGRAVTRKRWPNGVDEPAFFEKQLAIVRAGLAGSREHDPQVGHHDLSGDRHRRGTGVDRPAGVAGSACAAVAVRRTSKPGPATRIVFDLDPGDGVTFRSCARWRTRCAISSPTSG